QLSHRAAVLPDVHSYPDYFFYNDPATTEIYTLSLHDALPISLLTLSPLKVATPPAAVTVAVPASVPPPGFAPSATVTLPLAGTRSEEHTSELQSRGHLVCRLLLEKKKNSMLLVPGHAPTRRDR